MQSIQQILVPISLAAGHELVIDYACVIAKGMHAELTLLHVFEPPNAMVGIVPGASIGGEVAAEQALGDHLLDAAAAQVRAAGIATVNRILERSSPPSQAILSHARDGFDLIVMGTHGRKGVSRLVLGSVAESVLRDAPCPVLTIHVP